GKIVDENRMRPPPSPARSRTRGHRTATAPMPVMISRSGRCPWRTSRRRPSSVNLSVWVLSQAATSASTACPNSVLAPLRKSSVSGSENVPGWVSSKTLVSVTRITPSVEKWRLEHPHDTPPYPFMPSPTFGLSSMLAANSVGRLLAQIGITCQKPLHRAIERDESLVRQWLKKEYPKIKAMAKKQ